MFKSLWKSSYTTRLWIFWFWTTLCFGGSLFVLAELPLGFPSIFLFIVCLTITIIFSLILIVVVLDKVTVNHFLRLWGYTRKVDSGPQKIWGIPSQTLQGIQVDDVLYYFEYPKRGYQFKCVNLKTVTLNLYTFIKHPSIYDFCAVCDRFGQVTVYKRPVSQESS